MARYRLAKHGWLFALVAIAPTLRAQSEAPTAEAILQQMEATYAATRSYLDNSSARFRNPDGSEGTQVDFKLWFSRPKFFRIDATTRRAPDAKPVREVMWFDGEMARMWSSTSPVVARTKIQLAGSKMFGTYAYHVPTMLEASYAGPRRLHQLESTTLAGEEAVEGVDCYHVKGAWQGDPYEVWVGKEDHLVRKIVANYKGYVMEELHRDITTNHPMDMTVFRFALEEEIGPAKKGTPPPRLPGERVRP
jgi:outer membrane lipoprotein-sorting protein